ncbi:ETX/MTX2 family pore-forming toxin [Bacillus toyonensis]|nr:ETX/MTX2 family pore-forming toxin [Bacillus toyonensis]
MSILRLDLYLPLISTTAWNPNWDSSVSSLTCSLTHGTAISMLHGRSHYVSDVNGMTITGNTSDFSSDSGMPNVNKYATALPVVALETDFTNTSSQTLTYYTPEYTETYNDQKSTNILNGFSLGANLPGTISAKVSAAVPEVNGTASVELSAQYQFNTTMTSKSIETKTLKIPPQPIMVPPGKKVHVTLYYATLTLINAPITYTGKMSGIITTNPNNLTHFPPTDLYSKASKMNDRCPNAVVNGDTGLILDSKNKSVNFISTGSFNGKVLADNFWVKSEVQNIPASTGSDSEYSVNFTQGDLIIIPNPNSSTNVKTDIYVCNCSGCDCKN